MMASRYDPCRRAARRRQARGGRPPVRRRRAAAGEMAARLSAALFPARLSLLRPAAGQERPRRRARPGEPNIGMARRKNWLLDLALDTLTLGRAHLGLALATIGAQQPAAAARDDERIARARLDEAVDGLRAAGHSRLYPSRPPRPRRLPPQRRRLGRRRARSRRGRGDRRAGADAALSLRHGARTRAARVRAERGVRAAQWADRRRPAEARAAGEAERGACTGEAAEQLAVAKKPIHRVRLSPARRGARRAQAVLAASAPSPTCHPGCEGAALRRVPSSSPDLTPAIQPSGAGMMRITPSS